ncbi:MAG: hypothetical protein QOF79_2108 [Actinomycetota bacterium]|nr:hypothetical protein [Actinomycetota bacterium]
MLKRRALAPVALTIIVAALLAGCGLVGSESATKASHSAAANPLRALKPVYPKKLTAATAKTETIRIADQIQDLIAKTDIIYVDNHDEVVPATKTAGSYYGVLRTVNVSPSLDPGAQAEAMAKLLETAGWIERENANDTGKYLVALSSSSDSRAWFLLLGGDAGDKKPVVTIQLASPDLP